MENVFLKNIHFIYFDDWFINLSDEEQQDCMTKYPTVSDYTGLELVKEEYDEEKGFEFKIIDEIRWNLAKQNHEFLKDL